jgi:dienelactone hydrolase
MIGINRGWWLAMLCLTAGSCSTSGNSSSSTQPPPITYACDAKTGLTQPLTVCSQAQPCTNSVVFTNGQFQTNVTVTTASDLPVCATYDRAINDGPPITWTDADGVARYTCLFTPSGTSLSSSRPLLIFFHGTGGSASDVYNSTGIRVKANNYDLTGDGRLGFILASVQGRNLHEPNNHTPGRHQDNLYRDMASPSTNPDVAHLDQLIDTLVGQGIVDPTRIYVMGWSNGAAFAQLYAIARYQTNTPGGNQVAAAAVYAFGDPFANIDWNQTPSCELNPYPTSAVPLYLVNRTCDALTACAAAQQTAFGLPPGRSAVDWVAHLRDPLVVNDPNVTFQLVDLSTFAANPSVCDAAPTAKCNVSTGTQAHLRWPNGPLYGSGDDWEVQMLEFLKANPHL